MYLLKNILEHNAILLVWQQQPSEATAHKGPLREKRGMKRIWAISLEISKLFLSQGRSIKHLSAH